MLRPETFRRSNPQIRRYQTQFGAACAAAARIFGSGRVPDDASCDLLARRIAGGAQEEGGADLAVYDLVARGGGAR